MCDELGEVYNKRRPLYSQQGKEMKVEMAGKIFSEGEENCKVGEKMR